MKEGLRIFARCASVELARPTLCSCLPHTSPHTKPLPRFYGSVFLFTEGGYVAGRRNLVRAAANRLGAPGVAGGATLGQNQNLYQVRLLWSR